MKQKLEKLWEITNTHSQIHYGEWIDPNWEGINCPPRPITDEELLDTVIEHISNTI